MKIKTIGNDIVFLNNHNILMQTTVRGWTRYPRTMPDLDFRANGILVRIA